jgi:hypothetical protein
MSDLALEAVGTSRRTLESSHDCRHLGLHPIALQAGRAILEMGSNLLALGLTE